MKNMKIGRVILATALWLVSGQISASAQSTEMQQLLLNIEKLTQLKSILSDMKTGYQIYQQGYGMVSGLSKGNFNLHDVYLSGLLAVNPAVKKYQRIPEILTMQVSLVSEYQNAIARFRQSGTFSRNELDHLSKVYQNLIRRSSQGMDELISVITAGKLRMSDADRLEAINRIYNVTSEHLNFLRVFNRQGIHLSLGRTRDEANISQLKKLYGLTN